MSVQAVSPPSARHLPITTGAFLRNPPVTSHNQPGLTKSPMTQRQPIYRYSVLAFLQLCAFRWSPTLEVPTSSQALSCFLPFVTRVTSWKQPLRGHILMGPTENAPSRCPTALPASLPLSLLRPVTPGATLPHIPPEHRRRALTTVGT